MADMQPVYDAFRKADAAGNTQDAQKLADYIRSSSAAPRPSNMPAVIYPNTAAGPGANPTPTQQMAAPQSPTPAAPTMQNPSADDVMEGVPDDEKDRVLQAARMPGLVQGALSGVQPSSLNIAQTRASFAGQQAVHDNMLKQQVVQQLGYQPQFRSGPDAPSGSTEYFDRDKKTWQSIPSKGLGDALPGALETIGGVVGSLIPAPVLSGAAGAGIGRGAGVAIKNYVGNKLGLNDDMDQRDLPNPFNEGGGAAATTLAGGALVAGAPAGMRLMFKGEDVAAAPEARAIMDAYQQNKGIVDTINQATEADRTAQGMGPLDLGVGRTAAIPNKNGISSPDAVRMVNKQPMLMEDPKLADREIARRNNNQNVLDLYWQTQVDNPQAYPNLNSMNWQAAVRDDFEKYQQGQLGPYQTQAETAIQAATAKVQQGNPRTSLDATQGGQIVRKTISDASQASSAKVDQAYSDYQTAAKYAPDGVSSEYAVPVTDRLNTAITAFDKLQTEGLLPSQASQAARYRPQNLQVQNGQEGMTMDLAMLDRSIKDLRSEWRSSMNGQAAGDMSDANRNRLLGALTDARDQFMAKPENMELSASLTKAEAEYTRHQNDFSRSFAADFLERETGTVPKIKDANVLDTIMKNKDIEGSRQLAQVVNGEPGAKKAILDYTNAFYNDKYTKMLPDGTRTFDPRLHQKFIDNVYPTLQPFLGPVDQTTIGKIGGLIQRVQATSAKQELAETAWGQTPAGRMGKKLNGETFITDFFDSKKSFGDSNYQFMKSNIPESIPKMQKGITSELTNRSRDPATGSIDVDQLSKVYQPLKERFQNYFGKGYTDNIDRFITANRALNTRYDAVPQYSGASLATKYSKLILGPLSAENRKLTFFKEMRASSYANRLESALYDPKALSDLVTRIEDERPIRAYMGTGAGVAYDDYNR